METIKLKFFNVLYIFKQLLQCSRKLNGLRLRCLRWRQSSFLHVKILLTKLKEVAAGRISQDGRIAYNSLTVSLLECWSNPRLRAGILVGLVAFPAWKSHLFFDHSARDYDFYYINYAFYFNTIRAYLAGIFLCIGFFIAAPLKWKFKWWALPVVVFCITEIYAESYYTHWTDFYQPMPAWQTSLIMLFCMPALFFSIDYLVYRKYHLKDGNLSRIDGIIKAPGIGWEQKGKYLEQLMEERKDFNSRI